MVQVTRFLLLCVMCFGAVVSCKGQWIATHEYASYKETRSVACFTLGYCRSCRWLHNYHWCSYGPYNKCPGTRLIMVEVTPEDGYYINYPHKVVRVQRERFIEEVSPCVIEPRYRLQETMYEERPPS